MFRVRARKKYAYPQFGSSSICIIFVSNYTYLPSQAENENPIGIEIDKLAVANGK